MTGEGVVARDKDLERLARLRLIDDDFMRCVFQDQLPLVEVVLRIITGVGDLVLTRMETQRDQKNPVGVRSSGLDVWSVDASGTEYDLEVQRGKDPDPKRSRYYGSCMDLGALRRGQEFSELPERWVLFVMEHDPFGTKDPKYSFVMSDGAGRALGDGVHVLYANGDYREDNELGRLMADFCEPDPQKLSTPMLRKRVHYLKETDEGVQKMCEIFDEIRQEGIRQGIEQGVEQGIERGREEERENSIRSIMNALQLSAQQAMDALGVPEADRARYLAAL